jgi:hypothetical protein
MRAEQKDTVINRMDYWWESVLESVLWSVLFLILINLAVWALARRLTRTSVLSNPDRLAAGGMFMILVSVFMILESLLEWIVGAHSGSPPDETIGGSVLRYVLRYGSLSLVGGALLYYSRRRLRGKHKS